MALIRWTPFGELDKFFEEDFFSDSRAGFVPPVDVYEKGNNVIVEVPLAGINPEKVDVAVEDDILTVKGRMDEKTEVKEKDYYRKEVRKGSFQRTIQLPVTVQGTKASAVSENGLLKISIPKAKKKKAKQIKIKISK